MTASASVSENKFAYHYLFYVSQNYSFAILRPLQQAIRNCGGEVRWFFEGNEINRDYIQPDEKEIKSVEEVLKYQPRAIFAPGNEIPHFFPGVKTRLFHGFASEKRKRDNSAYSTIVRPWFDLYCTPGPDLTEAYSQAAREQGFFKVIETGWSKVDPLFWDDKQGKNKKNDKPVILVASTFTPRYTLAPHLQEQISRLSQNNKWRWLVTFHPKMDQKIVADYKAMQHDNLSFIETDNVIPLLQQADVLVCDSSSIKSEFLIQNKPVVAFRVEPKLPHLMHIEEAHQLEAKITQALQPTADYLQKVRSYADSIHPYYDGRSSYRVLQAVEDFIAAPDKPDKAKPIGMFRKFKIRKKLSYWK